MHMNITFYNCELTVVIRKSICKRKYPCTLLHTVEMYVCTIQMYVSKYMDTAHAQVYIIHIA